MNIPQKTAHKDNNPTFQGFVHHFAEYINRISQKPSEAVYFAAALSIYMLREGHTRLDLAKFAGKPFILDESSEHPAVFPDLKQWIDDLNASGVVGVPGDYRPIILEHTYCYLYRYWRYEKECADSILKLTHTPPDLQLSEDIQEHLRLLFAPDQIGTCQYIATQSAMYNTFTVITGGPGTGKTTTVAKIVAALLFVYAGKPFRIALAAPTGKAAKRLSESLNKMRATLNLPELITCNFPSEALTLHRLLGTIPGSTEFRYNKNSPLPYDLVIVDEASMIDIALMAKLCTAIPPNCRLLLLGDKDQLAAVEAGSVFGDICDAGTTNFNSQSDITKQGIILQSDNQIINNTPLRKSIVVLDKSYRFSGDSGIGTLSGAVNQGNYDEACRILKSSPECTLKNVIEFDNLKKILYQFIQSTYQHLIHIHDPQTALEFIDDIRILCALRQGRWGSASINRMITGFCETQSSTIHGKCVYNGLPVIITTNDYRYNLFNGDTGIIIKLDNSYSAFFRNTDGSIREQNIRTLPDWEPAYAITVHKSQGSEFTKTVLILPPEETPLITRELLYTAVTRSRKSIEIWGKESVLRKGIESAADRSTGIRNRLSKLK